MSTVEAPPAWRMLRAPALILTACLSVAAACEDGAQTPSPTASVTAGGDLSPTGSPTTGVAATPSATLAPSSEAPSATASFTPASPSGTAPPSQTPTATAGPDGPTASEAPSPSLTPAGPSAPPDEDADGDGYPAAEDCDDQDPDAFPGATEACDGRDQDCDTHVDEGLLTVRSYPDDDGDGFGDGDRPTDACATPEGYVANRRDCDDSDAGAHPGATETCDGDDDDCDDRIDEGLPGTVYPDEDGDSWGDGTRPLDQCAPSEGYVARPGDCDDQDAAAHPEANEICDGADNDCDDHVDEALLFTTYPDEDGDSWGDGSAPREACGLSEGYVSRAGDCDDGDASISPDATELCGGGDEDCDAAVDEGLGATWYRDNDDDSYGDPTQSVQACAAPDGYVSRAGDCNDQRGDVNPGSAEACDRLDQDCDSRIDEGLTTTTYYPDDDHDSYGEAGAGEALCSKPSGYVTNGQDCNDQNPNIKPGVIEDCSDSVDQDCSGNNASGLDASCAITGYAFSGAPDCGSSCYYDELHNIARNGAGQGSNNNGYNSYALGQLTDGARGVDTYSSDLGNGKAYEWVGWSGEDVQIYMRFGAERTLQNVVLGLNNLGSGGVAMPQEIQVFLSHSYNAAPYDVVVFRKDLGTLPQIPTGKRGDITLNLGGRTAAQIKIYLFHGTSWVFVDEVEVH